MEKNGCDLFNGKRPSKEQLRRYGHIQRINKENLQHILQCLDTSTVHFYYI